MRVVVTPARRRREARDDERDNGALGARDLLVAVGKLPEHPAREDLLDRAVDDPAREPRVEVAAELARGLASRDDPLERGEHLADLVHALLDSRAARHLAHEHAHEVRLRAATIAGGWP